MSKDICQMYIRRPNQETLDVDQILKADIMCYGVKF